MPPTDDADGIEPAIDGYWTGGAFVSEDGLFSNQFTDQHIGGTTFGQILDRGDQSVTVVDAAVPDGVLVSTSGGTQDVVLELCPAAYLVTVAPGTSAILTCGSITVEVLSGQVTIEFDGVVTPVLAGETVTVDGVDCEPGYFSPTGTEPCDPAPQGSYVSTVGATEATLCPVGTYSDIVGAASCQPAPQGSYVSTVGATEATLCPVGYTSEAGAIECYLIDNARPIADAGGPYLVAAGAVLELDGTNSSDPDGDSLSFSWSAGGIVLGSSNTATPTFSADEAGIYQVTLEACDPSGECDSASTDVVVYDPTAGFVTGGGWIDSPVGACGAGAPTGVCITDATGRASFAFVSRYKRGASVPDGQATFVFQAGNLRFQSDSYEWLVVSGRSKAQFKGTGSINGMGSFQFIVTVQDGDTDGFRIKITSGSEVVYDNLTGADDAIQNTQAIAGGSIVIHTK